MSSSQSDERPEQAGETRRAEEARQAEGAGQAERLGIAELAEQAGVTPRTVRYYVAEGLLPSPGGSGQQRTYSREHLLRLRAIKRLKDAYLPLEEIRRRLEGLSPDGIQALAEPPAEPTVPPPTSALDYLSRFLPGRSSRVAEIAAPAMPSAPAPAPGGVPGHGLPVLNPPPPAPAPSGVPVPSAPSAPSVPAAYVGPRGEPERDAEQSEQAKRAEQSLYVKEERADALAGYAADSGGAAAIVEPNQTDSSVWQRVTLAPGVELHYQPSDDETRTGAIARIVRFARELLA